TGRTEHAVARHDDRYRIAADCSTYRTQGLGLAELLRVLRITDAATERNVGQRPPDVTLEYRAGHIERHIECRAFPREIFVELHRRLRQMAGRRKTCLRPHPAVLALEVPVLFEIDAADAGIGRRNQQHADRARL